jgi:Glycosyltransferase 61
MAVMRRIVRKVVKSLSAETARSKPEDRSSGIPGKVFFVTSGLQAGYPWFPCFQWQPWSLSPASVYGDPGYDVRSMMIPEEFQEPLGYMEIPNARIQGRFCRVFDSDNRVFASSTWYGPGYREMGMTVSFDHGVHAHLSGRTLVLGSEWSDGYFHWLMDCLGKYAVFVLAGGSLDSINHVLLDRPPSESVGKNLDLLGISRDKIVHPQADDSWNVELAVVPTYPGHRSNVHPIALRFLADRLAPAATSPAGNSHNSRLLIGRVGLQRRLINYEALKDLLESMGFMDYQTNLRPETQAQDFAVADVVVAQHGAGLTNLLFCKPGTRVVELFSPDHPQPCFMNVCQALGLEHKLVWGRSSSIHRPLWNTPGRRSDLDYEVDVALVEKALGDLGVTKPVTPTHS